MVKRIVTFGCSFTYGIGLPDCDTFKDKFQGKLRASNQAWPAILSNEVGVPFLNKGYPAASNIEILWYLLETELQPDDLVIIMWSLPNRDVCFMKDPQRGYGGTTKPFQQLGPWVNSAMAKRWMVEMDEYDYQQRTWLYMHHAQLYLESKGVKYIHWPAYPVETCQSKPSFIDIKNLVMHGMANVDLGDDKSHPGPESHRITGEGIARFLRESGIIS